MIASFSEVESAYSASISSTRSSFCVQAVGLVERPQDGGGLAAGVAAPRASPRARRGSARATDRARAPGGRPRGRRATSPSLLLTNLAEAREERELVGRRLGQSEVAPRACRRGPASGRPARRASRATRATRDRRRSRRPRCGTRGWPRARRSACRRASCAMRTSSVRRASLSSACARARAGPRPARASSGSLVEPIERRERLRVARVVLEPRAPGLDGAARIVEHGLAQLAEPARSSRRAAASSSSFTSTRRISASCRLLPAAA